MRLQALSKRPWVGGVVWIMALAAATAVIADPRQERLIQVSGESPFIDCTADFPDLQEGTVYISSEVEPWVVVNPTDPDNIVGLWQADRWSNGAARGLAAGVSFDGGKTWETVPLPNLTLCTNGPALRASDPWLSFGPDGELYAMALATAPGISAMAAQKSTDGGLTWADPIPLIIDDGPFFNDKNSITADPTDAAFVYAVWDRLDFVENRGPAVLARSTDGGETFEPPTLIYDPGPANQTIGNQIVVLPDGTVVDFFSDIEEISQWPFLLFDLALKYSPDKGVTWLPVGDPIVVAEILSTFSVVDPDTFIPVRDAAGIFDVAVDATNGTLYAVWQDGRFSGFEYDSIAFSQSTDWAQTWSPPVKINRTPTNLPWQNQQAFVPSVEVNRKGRIGVTYYDFRFNGAETESRTDHWAITCSPDKRDCTDPRTWSGELRLTDRSFDMLQAPFANGLFLGDYVGLSTAVNEFVAMFTITGRDDPANIYVRQFDEGPELEEEEHDATERIVTGSRRQPAAEPTRLKLPFEKN